MPTFWQARPWPRHRRGSRLASPSLLFSLVQREQPEMGEGLVVVVGDRLGFAEGTY